MQTARVILILSVLCFTVMPQLGNTQTVPEEARRHMTRGLTAAEMAKTKSDFEGALSEFRIAIELAPEWPDAYYQLGALQDKLGKHDEAYNNLKRFLQLAPKECNTEQVQELIYKIEYKRDKAHKRKLIIDALNGSTIHKKGTTGGGACFVEKFIQVGDELKASIWCMVSEYNQIVPVEFDGSALKFKYTYYGCQHMPPTYTWFPCPWEVSVAADSINNIRLHFKVKEEWSRQFNGDYREVKEGEWDIQARMK